MILALWSLAGGRLSHTQVIPQLAADSAPAAVAAPDPRPDLIRAMLRNEPLEPYAEEMVRAADYYGIDWRLLPVIGQLESTGGAAACGGNAWGYDSCSTIFPDFSTGLWTVAQKLAAPPYLVDETDYDLCVWVSGHGCWGEQALRYLGQAQNLFAKLSLP